MPVDLDKLEPFPGDFWPEPDQAGYETLKESIRTRGRVDVPLDVVRRGNRLWLIDGRNRLRAIKELRTEGVQLACTVQEVDLTDQKVFHFIVAKATAGRHLGIAERVVIVVEHFMPEYSRRAAQRQRLGSQATQGGEAGRATSLAARAARLRPTTVKAAKFVKERCDEFPDALGPAPRAPRARARGAVAPHGQHHARARGARGAGALHAARRAPVHPPADLAPCDNPGSTAQENGHTRHDGRALEPGLVLVRAPSHPWCRYGRLTKISRATPCRFDSYPEHCATAANAA